MTMESINESKFPLDRVVGIGVAMPGLIERGTGRVIFSPNFGWNNIALQDELKSTFLSMYWWKTQIAPGYRRDKKYTAKSYFMYCRVTLDTVSDRR